MQIAKDTVIGTILDSAPETAPFFLEILSFDRHI